METTPGNVIARRIRAKRWGGWGRDKVNIGGGARRTYAGFPYRAVRLESSPLSVARTSRPSLHFLPSPMSYPDPSLVPRGELHPLTVRMVRRDVVCAWNLYERGRTCGFALMNSRSQRADGIGYFRSGYRARARARMTEGRPFFSITV